MNSLKYIVAISIFLISASSKIKACGPYYPENPYSIKIFRCCSPELEKQWQEGCRFQDYEKDENCYLWQRITSPSISLKDIEKVIYNSYLSHLKELPDGPLSDNSFAKWLSEPSHREDMKYVLIAKEIEELRRGICDPWYYAYDNDDEHIRLDQLKKECQAYTGERHAARYALQLIRLYFADRDFEKCIELWEKSISKMPQNIITNMIASYVGGAYSRCNSRKKAIELYTRSQDIGSLISMNVWKNVEEQSNYTDSRVQELEYIFNRFPNSPLLSVKLQEYVRNRETFITDYADWKARNFHDPACVKTYWDGNSLVADDEHNFYHELKQFALKAISSTKCQQKAMWHYALGYLYYLDENMNKAQTHLQNAESINTTPFLKESIRAFRFLINAHYANNSDDYIQKLTNDLKWLDERMENDTKLNHNQYWQYSNYMNYSFYYWQDVARKVLLGKACPRLKNAGNTTLAIQLANYASNRIYQINPRYKIYHDSFNDTVDSHTYSYIVTFDEYRTSDFFNAYDYSNQFFEWINSGSADEAAKYADRIIKPGTELDKFLNKRGYIDKDYIFEIVGTLYLREMNYKKAVTWLSKVSPEYQNRTNIAKEGYFNLDPFRYQFDKKHYISNSTNYKLQFAKEMVRLDEIMTNDPNPNKRANAKMHYAIGLRNAFGKCWYLTEYGYNHEYNTNNQAWFDSDDREGFKVNVFAQKAYEKVDALMTQAISEFTDCEQAAQAQLEMMNYATIMKQYPHTAAAAYVLTRCDNYHDYALQKK